MATYVGFRGFNAAASLKPHQDEEAKEGEAGRLPRF